MYNAILKRVLDRNRTKLVLTVGSVSAALIGQLDTNGTRVIALKAWTETGAKANWQAALTDIATEHYPKDIENPSFTFDGERLQIPGYDLPYGMLKWQGSSGDRARRAKLPNGDWSPDYFKLYIPDWAYRLEPSPLTAAEQEAISNHP